MTTDIFNELLFEQLGRSELVLIEKAKEYATDDRLHNFKIAAKLQNITPRAALAGMMAKHTVSIYDLCMAPNMATKEMWIEKITDHINYLLLLNAVISEELYQEDIII